MTKLMLSEWDEVFIKGEELCGEEARKEAQFVTDSRMLEVIETKDGLLIRSYSYVGNIRIGDIEVVIKPKLNGMPLYKLLKFTYGMNDLHMFSQYRYSIDSTSFFDILILALCNGTEELLKHELFRSYILQSDDLSCLRGRLDIKKICSGGGILGTTLPCVYYSKHQNHELNQVLLAGLLMSHGMTNDSYLKNRLNDIIKYMTREIEQIKLTRELLKSAENRISRLTSHYTFVLELVNILYESKGIQYEYGERKDLQGFMFDMNSFFESLVGKILLYCSKPYYFKKQYSIKGMFKYEPSYLIRNKKSPSPRPDFALMKEGKVIRFYDAKYRSLSEKPLPREMLYQLAIYAVSGIGDNTATIIYPTINKKVEKEKILINNPVTEEKLAEVILRPMDLLRVADLIDNEKEMCKLADDIIIAI